MGSLWRHLVLATLLAPVGLRAQTVLFQEDFETNGQFSMSPQWVWDGNAPVPDQTAACSGSWGIRKDMHGPSDAYWGHFGSRWMFHPIPILPYTMYEVSVLAGQGTSVPGSAYVTVTIVWWDPTVGNPSSLGGGVVVEPSSCSSPSTFFTLPPAAPPDMPNAQFGVLVYGEDWNVNGSQMKLDRIKVRTQPWKAQFVGSVLLGGAYDEATGLMRDDLRQQGLLPLTEPYTALGWPQVSGGGGETVTPAVLNAVYSGGHVVDWVRLELHDRVSPNIVVATRQALVLQDGTIIGTNGSRSVLFEIAPSSYYVAVRHRNHLGTITFASYTVPYPGGGVWSYPFSLAGFPSYGTDGRSVAGSKAFLWPGDVTGDHGVKYTGANNDRDPLLVRIGGSLPTATISGGYWVEDVNLDGVVKYTGANNDRDPILRTVGGSLPTAVRTEQMP